MLFIGVDPGLDGAVAILDGGTVELHDAPCWATTKRRAPRVDPETGEKSKRTSLQRDYNIKGMVDILQGVLVRQTRDRILAVLENVHAMPREGAVGAFKFGRGLGIWQGIFVALEIPYQMLTPQRWKGAMMDGMGHEKDASIVVAQRLFPSADIHLKKHHGRADALLMAEYLRRTMSP